MFLLQEPPAKEDKKKDKKSPSRGNSAKSRDSENKSSSEPDVVIKKEPERYWPFSGYDMGDNMIEACGVNSGMFPADGGQIRVDKTQFMEGACVLNAFDGRSVFNVLKSSYACAA